MVLPLPILTWEGHYIFVERVGFHVHECCDTFSYIESSGINMSQKRSDGAIVFTKPQGITIIRLIRHFKDNICDHRYDHRARPLYQLVANATKSGNKTFTWDPSTDAVFEELKTMVHKLSHAVIDRLPSCIQTLQIMPTAYLYLESVSLIAKQSKNLSVSWAA